MGESGTEREEEKYAFLQALELGVGDFAVGRSKTFSIHCLPSLSVMLINLVNRRSCPSGTERTALVASHLSDPVPSGVVNVHGPRKQMPSVPQRLCSLCRQ